MRKWRPKYLELNELWNPLLLTGLVSFQDQIFLRIATLIQFTDPTCVCNIVIWSRERNFNISLPFWQGRGLTGLKNLGNTCYMNSIIQCISHCTLLTNFFVDGSYRWHSYFKMPDLILDFILRLFFLCFRDYLNHENIATRGDITDEVSSTLKALWSGQYRSISCKDLKVLSVL